MNLYYPIFIPNGLDPFGTDGIQNVECRDDPHGYFHVYHGDEVVTVVYSSSNPQSKDIARQKANDILRAQTTDDIGKIVASAPLVGTEYAIRTLSPAINMAAAAHDFARNPSVGAGVAAAAGALPFIPRISGAWGRSRLIKEMQDNGFVLQGPTNTGGGLMYTNDSTGETIRIMPKPVRAPYSGESPAKFQNGYYYRYQATRGGAWSDHFTIPDK